MEISTIRQAASFLGAMIILAAYVGHQMKWMDSDKPAYNLLNAVGSAILAYIALHPFQLGFVVLEATWAVLSIYVLARGKKRA